MRQRSTIRASLALAAALATMVLTAAPAAAWYEQSNTGETGGYSFQDYADGGARCLFENNSGQDDDELDRVRAREFQSHGPFGNDSKIVAWFQLQRNTPPHNDNLYQKYAKSPKFVGFANEATLDYFGPYTFQVPENTTSRWRIRALINYYNVAGTEIVGRVRGIVEVYRHKRAGSSTTYDIGQSVDGDQYDGYCKKEF